ncbi:hypothetical protein SAMN04487965_1479 [Microbulbifer donghaiensis]|uniref:Uncharacterized protein n=1 Tax=Microbulbifer donghaiensis TaxID=494016 RepID=A0A1M4Z9F6_9GAMM|nr:hypothetical protein [Microbulbifer donghaiensis]SHF14703.1 hypothetical protein SAMN04487965_1479 [Microbulbifer donghaiensis]
MDNHDWLMNSEVLTILRQLRKRLKAEFDINLRFSGFDFEQQLALAKSKTVDTETLRMIAELELRRGEPFRTGDEIPMRLYRGQPILQEPPKKQDIYELIYGDELALHQKGPHEPQLVTKTLRGQQVLREQNLMASGRLRIYRGRFLVDGSS